jgi:hypothetical protein
MIIGRKKKVNAASKYRASHKPGYMQSGLTINIDIYIRRVHFEMDCVTVYHRLTSTMLEEREPELTIVNV